MGYPVDCWRFFTDGMIALAKYYGLEIMHAHTNCAPDIDDVNWYSEKYADSMLVAKKGYEGIAKVIDLKDYKCKAANHKELMGEMSSYEEAKKRWKDIEEQQQVLSKEEKLTHQEHSGERALKFIKKEVKRVMTKFKQ